MVKLLLTSIAFLIATSTFASGSKSHEAKNHDIKDNKAIQQFFKQPIFKSINIDNSLFTGNISKIVQDSNGFIWISGTKGLGRFDGYNIVNFTSNKEDHNAIEKDSIRTIAPDHNGGIWIAYNNSGLGHYNATNNQFSHFPHLPSDKNSPASNTIRDIVVKKNGDLWLGTTKGLDHFNVREKVFTHFLTNSEKRHANWIFDLTLDKSEKL